jgi:hypothetical protein
MGRARTVIAAGGVAAALLLAGPAHARQAETGTGDNVVVTNGGPVLLSAGGDDGRVVTQPVQYYATRDGGFVGRGQYLVEVIRGDRTRTYSGETPCGGAGTIRVGDLVRIRVDSGVVAAGSRHHC